MYFGKSVKMAIKMILVGIGSSGIRGIPLWIAGATLHPHIMIRWGRWGARSPCKALRPECAMLARGYGDMPRRRRLSEDYLIKIE